MPLYSTHVRTTVYDYAVQATPTCAENKFLYAHTARFRIHDVKISRVVQIGHGVHEMHGRMHPN